MGSVSQFSIISTAHTTHTRLDMSPYSYYIKNTSHFFFYYYYHHPVFIFFFHSLSRSIYTLLSPVYMDVHTHTHTHTLLEHSNWVSSQLLRFPRSHFTNGRSIRDLRRMHSAKFDSHLVVRLRTECEKNGKSQTCSPVYSFLDRCYSTTDQSPMADLQFNVIIIREIIYLFLRLPLL